MLLVDGRACSLAKRVELGVRFLHLRTPGVSLLNDTEDRKPILSVSCRSFSKSMLSSFACFVISAAALAGITPTLAWVRASAASISR
jgi:hypothetical protein